MCRFRSTCVRFLGAVLPANAEMVDTIDAIEANSLLYKDPRKSQVTGAVSIPVLKPNGDRLAFQLSFGLHDKLQCVWTVTRPQNGDARCNLDLKFMPENDTLKGFLKRIDEGILRASSDHREWFSTFQFKEGFGYDAVKHIYQPLVKRNEKYAYEAVRVKVVAPGGPSEEPNKYATNVFIVVDEDIDAGETVIRYKKGSVDDLVKGSKCIVTVDTQGLWFAKHLNTYGLSLVATTILLWPDDRSKTTKSGVMNFNLGTTVMVLEEF